MQTKHVSAQVEAASNSGAFDLLLSNGALDRDGETLSPNLWVQPLPDRVAINVNHSTDVADIVGSGRPWLDAKGTLRVSGTFADTAQAQHIRSLVRDGHLKSVSVEFLRRPDGRQELIGGAFVSVPANPEARVLASKSALTEFKAELNRLLGTQARSMDDDLKAVGLLRLRLKLTSRP